MWLSRHSILVITDRINSILTALLKSLINMCVQVWQATGSWHDGGGYVRRMRKTIRWSSKRTVAVNYEQVHHQKWSVSIFYSFFPTNIPLCDPTGGPKKAMEALRTVTNLIFLDGWKMETRMTIIAHMGIVYQSWWAEKGLSVCDEENFRHPAPSLNWISESCVGMPLMC